MKKYNEAKDVPHLLNHSEVVNIDVNEYSDLVHKHVKSIDDMVSTIKDGKADLFSD